MAGSQPRGSPCESKGEKGSRRKRKEEGKNKRRAEGKKKDVLLLRHFLRLSTKIAYSNNSYLVFSSRKCGKLGTSKIKKIVHVLFPGIKVSSNSESPATASHSQPLNGGGRGVG